MARSKGGGGSGGQNQQGEGPLKVEVGDVKHGAHGWHVDVTVRYKNKLDADDTGTLYFLTEGSADKVKNDKDAESITLDKGTRSGKTTLVFEKGGQKKLFAVLEGHETSQPVMLNLPKTDESKAAKIQPLEFVKGNHCAVNIQVLSKGDTPVKGAKVRIDDTVDGTTTRSSNAKGICKYEFDIKPGEDKRKLFLQVLGTDIELPFTVYF